MLLSTQPFATYNLLSSELKNRGYTVTTEVQNGRLFVNFTSPEGGVWHTSAAHIHYPFTSSIARELSRDKAAAYRYAQSKNIPVPFTRRIEYGGSLDENELKNIIETHAPLIVKPNDSSLSRGLTLHIDTVDTLKYAVESAHLVKDSDALIQKQVSGEEVRFIVIKGKVMAALLRQTPRVVGDGKKTTQQLIEEENAERQKLVFPYLSYPQLTKELIGEEYFSDQRVLADGELLEFSKATMIRNGCSVYEIIDQIHPSYIEEIERLVADIDTSFLVADFLIQDYRSEKRSDNHWFLEFNSSPVLKLCYGCRDGKMFNILPLIADLIEESLR